MATVFNNLFTREALTLADVLRSGGVNMRLVGGAVRDFMLGMEPKDLDFAVDQPPEHVMRVLEDAGIKVVPTGLQHGTITAVVGGEPFELTTLRVDVDTDGRHATVEWTNDWRVDAERRDFTINAMAIDMDGNLHDFFGGQEDLKNRVVRFVGNASERLAEDHLRALRWFRFRQKVGALDVDEEAFSAISVDSINLDRISGERIWMEMSKILSGNNLRDTLGMMQQSGVLRAIGLVDFNFNQAGISGQLTSTPVGALASGLVRSKLKVQQFNSVVHWWKVSAEERDLLNFLLSNWQVSAIPVDAEIRRIQDLAVNPRVPKDWIMELCAVQANPTLMDTMRQWDVPEFPVRGQDLLDGGMTPGKEVGSQLRSMREAWVNSRFVLSKQELLAM